MSDTKSIGKATPIKWSMPHDPEAWPDTGRVMNAQEAAVAFNALIDRLTQLDKLARELSELLEAAKEALIVLDELVDEVEDMQEYKLQRPIEERLRQAISKCESGRGSE